MPGTFQIGGLVSGLDTGKIIEQLMTVEQRPLRQLESQQQLVKDRKAALTELTAKLSALRSKTLALMLSSTSQARSASSSDTSVATASAAPGASIQSATVNVISLATKSSLTSATAIGEPLDATVPLASAGFATTPTSGSFSINGVTVTVNAATDSLNDVIANISTSVAGVTASQVGDQLQLESAGGPIVVGVHGDTSNFLQATKLAASSSTFNGATWTNLSTGSMGSSSPTATLANARLANPLNAPTGDFTINGVNFTWDETVDTISGLVTRINNSAAKVTASYDAATDRFTLVAKDTGPAAISVMDNNGNLMDSLGLATALQSYGAAAQYTVNGGPVQSSTSNVVTDAITGVTMTLKGTGTTTLDVAQDVSATVTGVKDFVKAYNEALELVRQQTAVDPATNEPSIFTGNSMIHAIETHLRRVTNTADNSLGTSYTELPRIGISSGPIGSVPGTTNAMVLDEAKLTQALQSDPTAVGALLASATGPISTLNTYLLGVTSYTGPLGSSQTSADRQIRELDGRMRTLQQRLNSRQAALEKKFADLETALAKMQAQGAQLSGQLGQLGALSGGK